MTEVIVEFGNNVLVHQKNGEQHRLVLCNRPPPQIVSDWVNKDQVCYINNFSATWEEEYEDLW